MKVEKTQTENSAAGDRLPCPFCGSDQTGFVAVAPWDDGYGRRPGYRSLACIDCWSHGPRELTDDDAVRSWNIAARCLHVPNEEANNYSLILNALGMEEGNPVAAVEFMLETLRGIAGADWRQWEELASPEEFVRWAKSRANHALMVSRAGEAGVNLSVGLERIHIPKGGMCCTCTKLRDPCNALPFGTMPVIGTTAKGEIIVRCTEHDRVRSNVQANPPPAVGRSG